MPHPKGGYRNKDGKRVPGVTTIEGRFEDKSALIYWAFKQGQRYERGEINGLYEDRDKAGELGTIAHDLFEKYLGGKNYEIEAPAASINAVKNAIEWFEGTKMKVVSQEVGAVSEKYQFGGCLDAIGVDRHGRYTLLDWKTSNKGPFVGWLCQISAYKHLWELQNPDKLITGGFHIGRFSKEHADFAHHYWSELDDAWEQFKLFRRAYDIDKKLEKRV